MMKHTEARRNTLLATAITFAVVGTLLLTPDAGARLSEEQFEDIVQDEVSKSGDLTGLNAKIDKKAESVRDLEERLQVYQDNVEQKQKEKLTLESQLSVIEDKIESTGVEIEKASIELDVLQLEIEVLQQQIRESEKKIEGKKEILGDLLRDIYVSSGRTPLEVTFGNDSFSEFYSELEYKNRIQTNAQDTLDSVQRLKTTLTTSRNDVRDKKADVSEQRTGLELEQEELNGEETYKAQLLEETGESEEKFQELLEKVQSEQSQIEGQIASLEATAQQRISKIRDEVQARLADQDETNDLLTEEEQSILEGADGLIWPITSRLVTCGYHCEGYPFARYFQHSGIDIATPMGSAVKAAGSGFVTIARFDGSSNYAFIMISHGDGISTVYAHVSSVSVSANDYVVQGQTIAGSGGMPGTPGAGPYSTGPHLHFETRVDGIPTNPCSYISC